MSLVCYVGVEFSGCGEFACLSVILGRVLLGVPSVDAGCFVVWIVVSFCFDVRYLVCWDWCGVGVFCVFFVVFFGFFECLFCSVVHLFLSVFVLWY